MAGEQGGRVFREPEQFGLAELWLTRLSPFALVHCLYYITWCQCPSFFIETSGAFYFFLILLGIRFFTILLTAF